MLIFKKPISDENYNKISELSDFIAEHIKKVGKEQTNLDFLVGLNLYPVEVVKH